MRHTLDSFSSSEIFEELLHSKPTLPRASIHAILIQHKGEMVWEYAVPHENLENLFPVYSITKSVVSLAYGKFVERFGDNCLQNSVRKLCSEIEVQEESERLSRLTIHHLLNQTSGIKWREMGAKWGAGNPLWEMEHHHDWIYYVLNRGFSSEPGRHFNYSSGASHLLPYLLGKLLGSDSGEFILSEVLFPLGIDHLQWESDPMGNLAGGKGLHLRPRDVLKLATPILKNDPWIQKCRQNKVHALPQFGDYGYQWWFPAADVVSAMGFGGQNLLVDTKRDLAMVVIGQLGKEYFFLPQELFAKIQERCPLSH